MKNDFGEKSSFSNILRYCFSAEPLICVRATVVFCLWLNTSTPPNCAYRAETNEQVGYYLKSYSHSTLGDAIQLKVISISCILACVWMHTAYWICRRFLCGNFVQRFTEMQGKVWWSMNKIQYFKNELDVPYTVVISVMLLKLLSLYFL